jgi:hypothetical protein
MKDIESAVALQSFGLVEFPSPFGECKRCTVWFDCGAVVDVKELPEDCIIIAGEI